MTKLFLHKFYLQTPAAVNRVKDLIDSQQDCVSLCLKKFRQYLFETKCVFDLLSCILNTSYLTCLVET